MRPKAKFPAFARPHTFMLRTHANAGTPDRYGLACRYPPRRVRERGRHVRHVGRHGRQLQRCMRPRGGRLRRPPRCELHGGVRRVHGQRTVLSGERRLVREHRCVRVGRRGYDRRRHRRGHGKGNGNEQRRSCRRPALLVWNGRTLRVLVRRLVQWVRVRAHLRRRRRQRLRAGGRLCAAVHLLQQHVRYGRSVPVRLHVRRLGDLGGRPRRLLLRWVLSERRGLTSDHAPERRNASTPSSKGAPPRA